MKTDPQIKDDSWPTHPNGKRKTLGEMTKEEQKQVLAPSLARLKAELESPEMRAAMEGVK